MPSVEPVRLSSEKLEAEAELGLRALQSQEAPKALHPSEQGQLQGCQEEPHSPVPLRGSRGDLGCSQQCLQGLSQQKGGEKPWAWLCPFPRFRSLGGREFPAPSSP